MSNTPDQSNQPATPATTKPPARRRIDLAAIEEIAKLVATKISEAEACRVLGINPTSWFKFKCRHRYHEKFAAALEKFRGEKLKMHLANIEQAATGEGPHARKGADWRASAWTIERSLSSDGRFGDRVSVEQKGSLYIDVSGVDAIAAKVYGNGQVTVSNQPQLVLKSEYKAGIDDTLKKVYSEPQKAIDIPSDTKLLSERGEKL